MKEDMGEYEVTLTAKTFVTAGSEEEAEDRVKSVFVSSLKIISAKAILSKR